MTGKELKEFAATVPDGAVIEVRERSYGAFEPQFEIRATLTLNFPKEEPEQA